MRKTGVDDGDTDCDLAFDLELGGEEARVLAQKIVVDAYGEVTCAFDDDDVVKRAAGLSAVLSSDRRMELTSRILATALSLSGDCGGDGTAYDESRVRSGMKWRLSIARLWARSCKTCESVQLSITCRQIAGQDHSKKVHRREKDLQSQLHIQVSSNW